MKYRGRCPFTSLEYRKSLFSFNSFSIVKKITITALLSSVGIILKFIEIPTFSPFLKLDVALLPVLILLFFTTYPYIIISVIIISLVGLRGNIYGWLASFFFSFSLVNGIWLFNELLKQKWTKRLVSFNISFFLSLIITTLFMFIVNAFFITPLFFGMTYKEIVDKNTWSSFSKIFFSITDYKTAIFLFYSTFNFLLKGPILLIFFNLIAIPLFYRKLKKN